MELEEWLISLSTGHISHGLLSRIFEFHYFGYISSLQICHISQYPDSRTFQVLLYPRIYPGGLHPQEQSGLKLFISNRIICTLSGGLQEGMISCNPLSTNSTARWNLASSTTGQQFEPVCRIMLVAHIGTSK